MSSLIVTPRVRASRPCVSPTLTRGVAWAPVTFATSTDTDGHLCGADCSATKGSCVGETGAERFFVPFGLAGVCTPREDQTASFTFADGFCGTGLPVPGQNVEHDDQILSVTVGINLTSSGLQLGTNTDFSGKWFYNAVGDAIGGSFGDRYDQWENPGYGATGLCAWTVPFFAERGSGFSVEYVEADKAELPRLGGNGLCVCAPDTAGCSSCTTIDNSVLPPVQEFYTPAEYRTCTDEEYRVRIRFFILWREALRCAGGKCRCPDAAGGSVRAAGGRRDADVGPCVHEAGGVRGRVVRGDPADRGF